MLPQLSQCVKAERLSGKYCTNTNQLTLTFTEAALAEKYHKGITPAKMAENIDFNLKRITHDTQQRLNQIEREVKEATDQIDQSWQDFGRPDAIEEARKRFLKRAFAT